MCCGMSLPEVHWAGWLMHCNCLLINARSVLHGQMICSLLGFCKWGCEVFLLTYHFILKNNVVLSSLATVYIISMQPLRKNFPIQDHHLNKECAIVSKHICNHFCTDLGWPFLSSSSWGNSLKKEQGPCFHRKHSKKRNWIFFLVILGR